LRVRSFAPPSTFLAGDFAADGLGNGGWVNCRGFSAMVGKHWYLGGGIVFTGNGASIRVNRRFFRIDVPLLYAARSQAEKNAAVLELNRVPVNVEYPSLTYDEARQRLMLVETTRIWSYDTALDEWTDVSPPGWNPFIIKGWMGCYDPETNAHYVREGSGTTSDPMYAQWADTAAPHAGKMRRIQFADAVPSRYSTILHGGAKPFNNVETGVKHVALLYDDAADELIQCGADFTPETSIGPTIDPTGKTMPPGGIRRDMFSCKVRAAVAAADTTAQWKRVQPFFAPNRPNGSPGIQGAFGPDQVGFVLRTAVTPQEYWIIPGAYRGSQYPDQYYDPYKGDPVHAMRWTRTQAWDSFDVASNRRLIAAGNFTDPKTQVPIATDDVPKFWDYDPATDKAYCINDNFDVFAFNFKTRDYDDPLHLGNPGIDDDGNACPGWINSGGSLMARVRRRIYGLGAWQNANGSERRMYLCWYDIDSKQRGLVPCPFLCDPLWTPNNPNAGNQAPEEGAGVVALNGRVVVIPTMYFLKTTGDIPVWDYDPLRRKWTAGQPAPGDVYGDLWCAIPSLNSVLFFGNELYPDRYPQYSIHETDSRIWLYRVL
jgi:hypothetical protein